MSLTIFHSPGILNLDFEQVIDEIKSFLEQDQASSYKLTIGSDSEERSDLENGKVLELITAVVIYRKGYGGRYFWCKKQIKGVKTLRDKIYNEVLMSIDIAKLIVPELKTKLEGTKATYDLEIHIDVGETGATRAMIKEVVGIVSGNGFVARTKPDSYAASNIADRHT